MKTILLYPKADQVNLAILEQDHLVGFESFPASGSVMQTGTVIACRIKNRYPGLDAVSVDMGMAEDGFLPLDHKIPADSFAPGTELALQIKKLPEPPKRVVLTENIALSGRYLVITVKKQIGVSTKITDPVLRGRLKKMARHFPLRDKAGYIFRTECAGAEESEIQNEASILSERFQELFRRQIYAPVGQILFVQDVPWLGKILEESGSGIEKIWIETKALYDELLEQVKFQHLPLESSLFSLYQDSRWKLEDVYKVPSALDKAQKSQVYLSDSEGYLFIEKTAALTAIDVNSGFPKEKASKEDAVTNVNLAAVPEIARQIRLRNISGIILIDFINMQKEENRQRIIRAFTEAFQTDSRKINVYGFTHLGLLEVSREKKGPSLN